MLDSPAAVDNSEVVDDARRRTADRRDCGGVEGRADVGWLERARRDGWARARDRREIASPVNSSWQGLPIAEFGFPGPLRDRLVAGILDGSKTSTTALLADYEVDGEPLPGPGDRSVVVDSAERPVAVIELTEIRVVTLGDVDLQHVIDEGEGDRTIEAWRAGHEEFWSSPGMLAALGDPGFGVNEQTLLVLERFVLVERLAPPLTARRAATAEDRPAGEPRPRSEAGLSTVWSSSPRSC